MQKAPYHFRYQPMLLTCIVKLASLVVLAVLVLLPITDSHATGLKAFEARFTAYHKGGEVGHVLMSLTGNGAESYRLIYDSNAKLLMLNDRRYEESVFKMDNRQIIPHSYRFTCSGIACRNKNLNVIFDQANRRYTIDQNAPQAWNGELDNQLFRLDIPLKLAEGIEAFDYHFINYRGELKHYIMQVTGTEQLDLPYGKLDGIKVKIMRKSQKRQTYAWFSPELDYAMVRLQQFKEGEEQGDVRLADYKQM